MPAMTYGVGVTGINDTDLLRIRRVVRAACTDHTDSKSLSLYILCAMGLIPPTYVTLMWS